MARKIIGPYIESQPLNENFDELYAHLADNMPHLIQDKDTGKTYRYGLQVQNGVTQFIYEEVS
jgi:hypothetical protein